MSAVYPIEPALPRQDGNGLRFSDYPLVAVVLLKPVVDAFFELTSVKFGYMAFIFFAAFFCYVGRQVSGSSGIDKRAASQYRSHFGLTALYFSFLLVSLAVYLGSFNEIFKIMSPFILFLCIAPLAGPWFRPALGVSSLLLILANACLFPFDYGWAYWGTVKTFKGFYYFKTDLAYAVSFAILGIALWQRFRFTPILIVATLIATAEVVLANSRLNYLLYSLILAFIAFKGGMRPLAIARNGLLLGTLAVVAAFFYDAKRFLDFDMSSLAKFTQGRDRIWDVLIDQGVLNYSASELLFGKGLFADVILFAENVFSGQAHNAHNEWLHLVITQGVFGIVVYGLLWLTMYRFVAAHALPRWARGVPLFAFTLVFLQSFTAVISSFATKTWPLVFILIAVASTKPEQR